MPTWDASLYLRFADERTQPALDLLNRIPARRPRRVIDLGCGPGNSTALLRERWPQAEVFGLDNSPAMIAAATASHPAGAWLTADVRTWADPSRERSLEWKEESFDVIFSNAAFQWVPDHATLFPRLLRRIVSGGVFAVQVPRHIASPVHQRMLEISRRPEWTERMTMARSAIEVGTPAFYYDLLQPLAARVDLWETEYHHVLENPAAILAWMRGTGLRPFLESFASDDERERFERILLSTLELDYPHRPDGRVLFPFRRLFMIAIR